MVDIANLPDWLVDPAAYERIREYFGNTKAVSTREAQHSGVWLPWFQMPPLESSAFTGYIILRRWAAGESGRVVIYLDAGDFGIYFSVWRGTTAYQTLTSIPLGTEVSVLISGNTIDPVVL